MGVMGEGGSLPMGMSAMIASYGVSEEDVGSWKGGSSGC